MLDVTCDNLWTHEHPKENLSQNMSDVTSSGMQSNQTPKHMHNSVASWGSQTILLM